MSKAKYGLFWLVVFSLSTADTIAQVSKGTFKIGPSVGYNRSWVQDSDDAFNNVALSLSVGGFAANNLEVAVVTEFTYREEIIGSFLFESREFYIGPMVTYMIPVSEELFFPIRAGIGFRSALESDLLSILNQESDLSMNGLNWNVGVGIEYLVTQRIGARLGVDYSSATLKDVDNENIQAEIASTFITLGVGFYFPRKSEESPLSPFT